MSLFVEIEGAKLNKELARKDRQLSLITTDFFRKYVYEAEIARRKMDKLQQRVEEELIAELDKTKGDAEQAKKEAWEALEEADRAIEEVMKEMKKLKEEVERQRKRLIKGIRKIKEWQEADAALITIKN
ncbi:hypothetical protein AGMMS49936_08690 [Endomicrobiia bacterium]|nr:hypothetical protein AGMMS49936_08690 [Endomicrobiia bacterium]